MSLCPPCLLLGYCRKLNARLVTDDELSNPYFIFDVKATAGELGITRDQWRDYIADLYRDYRGRIVEMSSAEVFLDMDTIEEASPYWFRDFCTAPRPGIRPRLRREARERVRVLATILRASFPDEAQFWGLRPDNDNDPKFRKRPNKK